METMTFTNAYVDSTFYQAGFSDDGCPFIAESYVVMIENDRGTRMVHNVTFNGCKVYRDEEGFDHFEDVRTEARAKAEALAARVQTALDRGLGVNLSLWIQARPVYGSDAYQFDGGIEDDMAWEDRCIEDERLGLRREER